MNAKKLLSLLLAMTLMASISVNAFAENDETTESVEKVIEEIIDSAINEIEDVVEDVIAAVSLDSTQSTTVYTQIEPQFTVSIPATVDVSYKATSRSFNVALSDDAMLDKNYFVRVSVVSANGYALENSVKGVGYEKSDSISYALSFVNYVQDGVSYANEYPYLYNAGQVMEYTISILPSAWFNIHSGYYSDTLTFYLDYVHTSQM